MKYRANIDVLFNEKRFKAGSEFEADKDTGLILVKMGWAEAVEEKKAPKKTAKSKK